MAKTTVPIELSSTPSIVDNGNATAITINSSDNVGIGTSSPRLVSTYKTVAIGGESSGGLIDMVDASSTLIAAIYSDGTGSLTLNADPNGSFSSSKLTFQVDGSERMRIDSSGNVGIGVSPSYKLHVTGTTYLDNRPFTGYNSSSEATLGIFGSTNDTAVNNGAVYNIEWKMYGSASGQYWYANYIARNGSRTLGAYCTGTTWTNSSDIANKENIESTKYGLSTVLATNPVDFNWKTQRDEDGNGKSDVGFIAQEMELVVPEVVTGEEGNKGISYGNLVAIAFKAIQELKTENDELKERITALENA